MTDKGTIKVKLVRSHHGRNPKQTKTLKGLGLSRIGQVREFADNPSVRGMISRVSHLVEIEC